MFSKPISIAFSFINKTKSFSVPDRPSAKATQASLPETIIIPFNKSSTDTWSFNIINIDEYPLCDNLHAFSEIVIISSNDVSPFLSKSKATIVVIILVIEAG